MTFRDLTEAAAGVNQLNADYQRHRRAARHLAEDIFATNRVLPALLEAAMN